MRDRSIDPHAVLQLARTADARFATARATIRDWSAYRRISELQQMQWDDTSEEASGERRLRVWIGRDRRVREEWDTGVVRLGAELEDLSNWPLFEPTWVTSDGSVIPGEPANVAGRVGLTFSGREQADFLLPGAERYTAVIDGERGILLRCEAFHGDESLMVEELLEVSFDESFDDGLFDRT